MKNLRVLSLILLTVSPWSIAAERPLTLADLIEIAQGYDKDLAVAKETISKNSALERATFGKLLPQISLNSQANETSYSNDVSSYRYAGERTSVSLQQAIYNPALISDLDRAEQETLMRESQFELAKNDRTALLINRYLEISKKRDNLELATKELDVTESNLKKIENLFAKKLANTVDFLTVKSRVAQLKAELTLAESELLNAKTALSELVGDAAFRPITTPGIKLANKDLDFTTLASWITKAEANSPLLKQAQIKIDIANANLKRIRSEHLPTLGLQVIYQNTNIGSENAISQRTESTVGSLVLSMPIYLGGSTNARIDAQVSDKSIAEFERDAVKLQIDREIRNALSLSKALILSRNASKASLNAANIALDASKKSFKIGVVDSLKVVERTRDVAATQKQLLNVSYDILNVYVNLLRWSGTLNNESLGEINKLLSN